MHVCSTASVSVSTHKRKEQEFEKKASLKIFGKVLSVDLRIEIAIYLIVQRKNT